MRPWKIPTKYPYAKLKLGDSFFATDVTRSGLTSAVAQWGKRNGGWKFSVRQERHGFRVTRVK